MVFSQTRRRLIPLIGVVVMSLAAAPAVAQSGCTAARDAETLADQTLAQINVQRRAKNLRALGKNLALTRAAADHACYMARIDKMTHTGAGGKDIGTRARAEGYNFRAVSENVAFGHKTAGSVVEGWTNSPAHRKAMLRGDLRDAGLAVRVSNKGVPYWALIMAQPR